MWGENWPADLDAQCGFGGAPAQRGRTRVQGSGPGRRLDTPVVPAEAIGATEIFRSGTPACCPVAADLVPAS